MRYRHVWPGFLLLGALAVLLVALLVWGDHFLSPGPAGGIRRLLEARAPSTAHQDAVDRATAAADGAGAGVPASDPAEGVAEVPVPPEAPPGTITAGVPRPPVLSTPQARYALDLGTFDLEEDAERAEIQLNLAGLSTVRFRQTAPARLFSVSLRRLPDGGPARGPAAQSGRDPGDEGLGPGGPGVALRIARSLPLRSAVSLAEQLRASGYDARVIAEAPQQGQVVLRHGNFGSPQEALTASRRVSQLGVPNEVIRVR